MVGRGSTIAFFLVFLNIAVQEVLIVGRRSFISAQNLLLGLFNFQKGGVKTSRTW